MEQQQMLCYDPKETINGFNLSFCKALLAKLEQLYLEGRVVDKSKYYTHIGASILNHLAEQMKNNTFCYIADNTFASTDKIEAIPIFIKDTKEFLSIFEENKPNKIIGGIDPAFCELLLKKLKATKFVSKKLPSGTLITLSGATAAYLNHLAKQILKLSTDYEVGSDIYQSNYEQIVTATETFLATLKEYKG